MTSSLMANNVRVALISEWLDPWRGGAETSTRQFMHHLMDAGVELHVYTRSRPSPTPGLAVHSISGTSLSRVRQSALFARRVERTLAHADFDIVHTFVPLRHADIYQPRGGCVLETIERNIALRRSAAGKKLKRYANHFNFKQRYRALMERQMLEADDGPIVVAISQYVARQFERHYSLPADRLRLIYNGVDQDETSDSRRAADRAALRDEFAVAGDELLVLAVAHNFRLKGLHQWMEAMARLRKEGRKIRSLVLGRGDAPRWHDRAARMGLSSALSFVGPTERVREFYHAADVLVHPTYYDPCSRVVLEGLACGLPCVTTRWDGAAEMIQDGVNGFVLDDPGDVDRLVEIIRRLEGPGPRQRIGDAALSLAGRVSMARHAAEMMKLYQEIAPARASK